jgi:ATP-dependent Clp protease protease subunit
MPIGVPRIIYCWGEELPAQWTDIYNFIFRRRMVFLMQYLDDELCNQICGLLINIHMEDRSKELEKKEMEKSGLFKSTTQKTKTDSIKPSQDITNFSKQNTKNNLEDLLTSDQDFGIQENNNLEQYTLQKITTEWLNWNAQFFDYSDEPYLYYLADILSKDFSKDSAYSNSSFDPILFSKLIRNLKNIKNNPETYASQTNNFKSAMTGDSRSKKGLDVYSPFRLLANFPPHNYNLDTINSKHNNSLFQNTQLMSKLSNSKNKNLLGWNLLDNLSQNESQTNFETSEKMYKSSKIALGQRRLKSQYIRERTLGADKSDDINKMLDLSFSGTNDLFGGRSSVLNNESGRSLYRKQTERVIQEEESKKVFMIINSFGGSVGNGITVHDALQFIKAGSLTLALGVAASAASLALAGGTIGERYVTEGCHTMIHQPESAINGQASDIWIDSQEIMKIRLDVAEIYSLATYRPRHKILRDLDRDFYLTATETIYYGLADEIATNDVLHDIIEMTNKVWSPYDSQQLKLLETRDSQTSGLDTQTQS